MRLTPVATLTLAITLGCSSRESARGWLGRIDTLGTGQILVTNPAQPMWTEAETWRVTEDLRLGSADDAGPELFGEIMSIEVDAAGRIYVLETQANELRIFNPDGSHLTTAGRDGGGPGEFKRPLMVRMGPDGYVWIPDPQNNRVSKFDTTGQFVTSKSQPGGFVIIPWPGGFDDEDRYYSPIPKPSDDGRFRLGLARYDRYLNPIDSMDVLRDPVDRKPFQHDLGDGGFMVAGVPFAAGFRTRLSPGGTQWGLFTGQYRLFEVSPGGDTLRTITRAFESLPVSASERDSAVANLEWFTRQGGTIDRSRFPDVKEAATDFFFDDEGNVWVIPVAEPAMNGRVADVFDPVGRYLGRVEFPFLLRTRPYPVIKNSVLHAVTTDDLDIPYVVRARISKPRT